MYQVIIFSLAFCYIIFQYVVSIWKKRYLHSLLLDLLHQAESSTTSPRSRRQSIVRATNTRGSIAAFGANKAFGELANPINNASTYKRPSRISMARVVPRRYSLMPSTPLCAGTQERRCKDSLPGSAASVSEREEIRTTPTKPLDDEQSP